MSSNLWKFLLVFFAIKTWIAASTGLGDDEAYYWDWTREMALSYYDHPAMVAWLINLSTTIFGATEFAVRLPSLVLSFLSTVLVFFFSRYLFDERVATGATVLFCLIPIYSLGSILMVPDIPMIFFWLVMLLIFARLNYHHSLNTIEWVMIGVFGAMAIMTKLTAVLFPLSFFLFLLFHRRSEFFRPGPWLATIIFLAGLYPLIQWNADNEWVSFAYHLSERQSGKFLEWNRLGQFVASQLAFLTPIFAILIGYCLWWSQHISRKHGAFLFWMSFPTLILFGLQPLFAEFKPHWTAPGFIALLPLASLTLFGDEYRPFPKRALIGLVFAFLIPINLLFYVQTKFPVTAMIHEQVSQQDWDPRWDPTNDLYGWPQVVEQVEKIAQTRDVFVAAHRYQLAAQLSFYTGQPAWALSSMRDQYDFFKDRPKFNGKDAVVVTDLRYKVEPAKVMGFSLCEQADTVQVFRQGLLAREFYLWVCENYLGD